MKRIAILIALAMVSSYIYGRVNSVWINTDIPRIFNDEDVDSIEYVMNAKGGYEQHLYSGDSVYVTQLTNDLVVTFDKHGVNTEKEVDMGLPSGTIWAGYNIGASSPEEYGDYYCYGDTIARNISGDESFPFSLDDFRRINDGDPIEGTQYDVATHEWGEDWCTPGYVYLFELFRESGDIDYWYYGDDGPRSERCADPSLAIFRGQTGLIITSSINGNRLFLPAAGAIERYYEDKPYPDNKLLGIRLRDKDIVGLYLLSQWGTVMNQKFYPLVIEFNYKEDYILKMGKFSHDAGQVRAVKPKPGGKFEFESYDLERETWKK